MKIRISIWLGLGFWEGYPCQVRIILLQAFFESMQRHCNILKDTRTQRLSLYKNFYIGLAPEEKKLQENVSARRCYKIQKGCWTKSTNELVYQSSCCSLGFSLTFILSPSNDQSHYFQSMFILNVVVVEEVTGLYWRYM